MNDSSDQRAVSRSTAHTAGTTDEWQVDCPIWCSGDCHGSPEIDLDHYAPGVHVPVLVQRKAEDDPPTIHVGLHQRFDGPHAVWMPTVQLAAGIQSDLTPEQAIDLVTAVMSQLAELEPRSIDRDEHCPPWCVIGAEQHAAELDDHEGASVHYSRTWLWPSEDKERPATIVLTVITEGDGAMRTPPFVMLPSGDVSIQRTRQLGLDLLAAAALAEVTR